MPLRRIFSEEPLRERTEIRLTGEAASHVVKVLRLRVGQTLVVFDGSGRDYDGRITGFDRDGVGILTGAGREIATESPASITLLQAVCRGQRMDAVIQKATELGVTCIRPLLTERSVVRLHDDQMARRREHWRRIAIGACEQCGRSRIPHVAPPLALPDALAQATELQTRLMLDPGGDPASGDLAGTPIGLLIGPEGGLTEGEYRLAVAAGYRAIRLGPRILRTETAPLAALAVLQFLCGDLGR
jgi:16S rRNA (uracil1498-N3)-methyltransferase